MAEVAVALRQALVSCLRSIRDERLEERLSLVSGCESALAAVKAEGVAELASLRGENAAADVLRDKLKASKATARREVEVAGELAKLADTTEKLRSGQMTPGQAAVIAQSVKEAPTDAPADERELIEYAVGQPEDTFVRTAQAHLHEREQRAGDLAERRRRQRAMRRASIRKQTGGMYTVHALLDPFTGARFEHALLAEYDRRWNAEHPDKRPTSAQRMADALAQLVIDSEPIHGERDDSRGGVTTKPGALWGEPGASGGLTKSDADSASHGLRIALAARDGGCIGCDKTGRRAEPHHIQYWRNGGLTDIDNLALLCSSCHDNDVHRHGKQISLSPNGQYTLDHAGSGERASAGRAHPRAKAPYLRDQHNQPLLC